MTKLLGPNDMSFFPIHEYREVLSPVVEPAEATTEAVINGYLADLGFSDPRSSSLKKPFHLSKSFMIGIRNTPKEVWSVDRNLIRLIPHHP